MSSGRFQDHSNLDRVATPNVRNRKLSPPRHIALAGESQSQEARGKLRGLTPAIAFAIRGGINVLFEDREGNLCEYDQADGMRPQRNEQQISDAGGQ